MITAERLKRCVWEYCIHKEKLYNIIDKKEEYTVDEICDALPAVLRGISSTVGVDWFGHLAQCDLRFFTLRLFPRVSFNFYTSVQTLEEAVEELRIYWKARES